MLPLISLSDSIQIPTYLFIISLVYCYSLLWVLSRAQKYFLNRNTALDVSLALMIGGLVGARFMHVLYENPSFYLNNPLEVFKIWQGGFVFYGGMVGAFLAATGYLLYKKQEILVWLDVFAPVIALGYAFGRLACFLNGCCYGKICHLPWGVQFPHLNELRHPTQVYAILTELFILFMVIIIEKNRNQTSMKWFQPKGQLFLFWLTFHASARIFMEFFRDDERGPFIFNYSVSTWVSLCLFFAASHFLFHKGRKRVFNKV